MNQQHTARWIAAGSLLLGLALGAALRPLATPAADAPLSPTAAAAQLREVLAIPHPLDRSTRLGELLLRSGPDALPALREVMDGARLDAGDPEIVSFAMWWARFDPQAALAWTQEDWRANSRLVVAAVFRSWGHAEPEAAFVAIADIPELQRDAAIDALMAGWYESEQPGLVERVQAMPDSASRQRVAEALARRIVLARGAEEATHWVDAIEDPAFQQMMARRVASAASEQGEASVVAVWAAPQVTSGEERPSGFPRRIGTRWIQRDAPAALAWLASLPAGSDRDDGVAESFRDWMRYAPGAALHWVQNAEMERWNEPAFALYARSLVGETPEKALEIATSLTNEPLRDRTATVIARVWAVRDSAAALAWLGQSDLPPEVKERVKMVVRSDH